MISQITKGSDFYGLVVDYHETRVKEGEAKLIGINNLISDNPIQIVNLLKLQSLANNRVSSPVFHVSLSFHEDENYSDDKLCELADNYMDKMGYADQPYVIYLHEHSAHQHIHIVSSRINNNGKTILDFQEMRRSIKVCEKMEIKYDLHKVDRSINKKPENIRIADISKFKNNKVHIKKHIKSVIGTLVSYYNFTSDQEFKAKLLEYRVGFSSVNGKDVNNRIIDGIVYYFTDDKGKCITKTIAASSINIKYKPTRKGLNNYYSNSLKLKNDYLKSIKSKFKYFNGVGAISQKRFDVFLKRNKLSVFFDTNSSGIYGVRFFDNKNKLFYKGSEIGLSWNKLKPLLNDSYDYKLGDEDKLINTIYNQLKKSSISKHYFEHQYLNSFIPITLYDEIKSKIASEVNNNEILTKLSPFIESFVKSKFEDIDAIKQKEQDYFNNSYKGIIKPLILNSNNPLAISLLLNLYNLKLVNNIKTDTINLVHNRCSSFLINDNSLSNLNKFDNLKSIKYHISKYIPKDNNIKQALNAINTNSDYLNEQFVFNKSFNFDKYLIHYAYGEDRIQYQISDLASKQYVVNNLKRLNSIFKDKSELTVNLLCRGISFSEEGGEFFLRFKNYTNSKLKLVNKDFITHLKSQNLNLINSYVITDESTLFNLNKHDINSEGNKPDFIKQIPNATIINELGLEKSLFNIDRNISYSTPSHTKDIGNIISNTLNDVSSSGATFDDNSTGYFKGLFFPSSPISLGFYGGDNYEFDYDQQQRKKKRKKRRKKL